MAREPGVADLTWVVAARPGSQGQLARAAGVPQQKLSKWERGKLLAPVSALMKVAKALGVGEDEALVRSGLMPGWLRKKLTDYPQMLEQIKNART